MKQFFFSVLAAGLVMTVGCKKSNDEVLPTVAAPLTITKADFASNYRPGGDNYTNGTVNTTASPVSAPAEGQNQSWDVSNLTYSSTTLRGNYFTPGSTAFPTATFGQTIMHQFGFGSLQSTGTNSLEFYRVADDGYFYLGFTTTATDVINVPSIGGTLTYAPQDIQQTPRFPELNLPVSYGSIYTNNTIVNNSNFIANAPGLGVNNVPGQARITDTVVNKIIASGTLTLKTFGKVRVLVNKQSITEKNNYFLGGAPAPTALLTMLGLTDGEIVKGVYYDFFAERLGRVGRISCKADGTTVTGAAFRVQ